MKLFLSLAALILVLEGLADCLRDEDIDAYFSVFKRQYSRQYHSTDEELVRKKIFSENLQFIHDFNLRHSYQLEMNQFTDYTDDEFVHTFLSRPLTEIPRNESSIHVHRAPESLDGFPDEMRWEEAVVASVKNQGHCGAGWAFAAVASIEAILALGTEFDDIVPLSVQSLIDCSSSMGNRSCQAGDIEAAFEYVIQNQGIDTDQSYPYQGLSQGSCRFTTNTRVANVTSYVIIERNNEIALQSALVHISPIAATIDASRKTFRFYKNGIYDDVDCSPSSLNHGLSITGYDLDSWIVRNSWGADWGERGYVRIARNKGNRCGIASHASYPIMARA